MIELDRPKALNALCDGLMTEVGKALDELEVDNEIGCVIITGICLIDHILYTILVYYSDV